MQIAIIIALALHVLAAVFWMGSTANLARGGGPSEILFPRQMGAVVMTVLTGGFLWSQLHTGGFGTWEKCLAVGVACAILAFLIQAVMVGGAVVQLKRDGVDVSKLRARMSLAHRIAAPLLMVTLVAMVIGRYL